jgi:hypothetical protein
VVPGPVLGEDVVKGLDTRGRLSVERVQRIWDATYAATMGNISTDHSKWFSRWQLHLIARGRADEAVDTLIKYEAACQYNAIKKLAENEEGDER